jgi:uncharacterized phage protein (TIGR02218 family)
MSTWTTCIKVKRTDGVTIGLTELDKDLQIGGVTYNSASGYSPSTYASSSSLSVNYADIEGILEFAGVSREQIRAGLYDFAEVELFVYDYEDDLIVKTIATGNWGESQLMDGSYKAEFRSLSQRMQQSVGNIYTAHCTAELGDKRCKVDVAPLIQSGTITSVASRLTIADSNRTEVNDYWKGGVITFLTGNNQYRSFEISASNSSGSITLFLPLSFPGQVGDTYIMKPGCDKSIDTCRVRYNNVVNFRGFPHVPGTMEILRIGKEGYV